MARGKLSPRRQLKLQRQADAVAMRLRGKSYAEIGRVLGITKQAAHKLVTEALEEMRRQCEEDVEILRQIEVARLEELHDRFAPMADPKGMDDPVAIDMAKKAAEIVLKAADRRAKLLGLDAPTKSELSGPNGAPIQAGVIAVPMQLPIDDWAAAARKAAAHDEAATQQLLEGLINNGDEDRGSA